MTSVAVCDLSEAVLGPLCPDLDGPGRRQAVEALWLYGRLLRRWAAHVNLVASVDLDHLWARHLQPALRLRSTVRALSHQRIVDVGSGAGLPGVPLAVTLPGVHFVLVESRRRRAHFLRHVVRELGLSRAEVVDQRVEDWRPDRRADLVVSRAVAGPARLAAMTRHCRQPHAFVLTPRGPRTAVDLEGVAMAWSRACGAGPAVQLAWP